MRRLAGWAILFSLLLLAHASRAQTVVTLDPPDYSTVYAGEVTSSDAIWHWVVLPQRPRRISLYASPDASFDLVLYARKTNPAVDLPPSGVDSAFDGEEEIPVYSGLAHADGGNYFEVGIRSLFGIPGLYELQIDVDLAPAGADFNGDGRSDILWRNSASGDNYLYPMQGTTIKPTEGYLRTVPQPEWQMAWR